MDKLFGSADMQLLAQGGAKTPVSQLSTNKVVGLYFSAHWCPPCRGFTPKLAEAYKKISKDKSFEVVFVSSDRDEESFSSYFSEMPWLAVPYADRDLKKKLSKKFKVSGIPALILLDGETGAVLSKDGRSVIASDPEGTGFPWAPKTLGELLGDELLNGEGAKLDRKEALAGKHLALYFSAHWCPPCKRFTPELVKTYAAIKARRDDVEFVFVSGDRDAKSFDAYFKDMPWLALPFDEERYEALSSHFEVQGIPTLVVLSPEGKLITTKGRAAASGDPEGADFPWHPRPVYSLEEATEAINDTPTLVVMCDKASTEDKSVAKAALQGPAKEAKAGEDEDDLQFAVAEEDGSIAAQVRKLCKLDGEDSKVKMVLVDIPDDGGYYVWDGSEALTEAAVREFTAAYKAKTLKRHQLG